MTDTTWLSYLGAATGIVGTITGIAGAVMGYVGYRRAGQLKALDLRLELRKSENDARTALQSLPSLLEQAKDSRIAVAAAMGQHGSSRVKLWTDAYEYDLSTAKALAEKAPDPNADHGGLTPAELETKLVEVYALRSKAGQMRANYEASLATDEKDREQLRADMRSQTRANLRQP